MAAKEVAPKEDLGSSVVAVPKAWKFPFGRFAAGGGGATEEKGAGAGAAGKDVVAGCWTAENADDPKRSSPWKPFPWTAGLDTGAGAGTAKDVSKFESPKRSSIPLVLFTGGKKGTGTDTGAAEAGADDEVPNESSSRGAALVALKLPRGSKSSKSSEVADAAGLLAKYEPPTVAVGFFCSAAPWLALLEVCDKFDWLVCALATAAAKPLGSLSSWA